MYLKLILLSKNTVIVKTNKKKQLIITGNYNIETMHSLLLIFNYIIF